jgi:NAD(P)-dependent dehydrogenase (short-subunit alcohol dehydrogenase family)
LPELAGKRVVVTGASAGIGRATALRLLEAGAEVVALDREPPAGLEAARWQPVDLADPASIETAAAALGSTPIAALCNVAGVPGTAGVETVMRVNFLGLRELSEQLRRRLVGGAVVNVASFAGSRWPARLAAHRELAATPGFEAGLEWLRRNPVAAEESYPYSKEALVVWTKLAALAWRAEGIRVNSVSPGPVETPILADFRASLGEEKVQEDVDRGGGRAGRAEEIAPLVVFLCGGGAGWITGADVPVDGGVAASFAVEAG